MSLYRWAMKATLSAARVRRLSVILALMVATGAVATLVHLKAYRDTVMAEAHGQVAGLSTAFAEHMLVTTATVDRALRDTIQRFPAERLVASAEDPAITRHLRDWVADFPPMVGMSVTDASGFSRTGSLPGRMVADRREHEYWLHHRDDPNDGLYISRPSESVALGRTVIILSRRVEWPDGRFAGTVSAVVEPVYFEKFYQAVNTKEGAMAAIWRADGANLARSPHRPADDLLFPDAPVLRRATEAERGSYVGSSVVDGVERVFGFAKVGETGLVVLVGLGLAEVTAPVRHLGWNMAALLAAVAVGALMLSVLMRQLHMRRRIEAAMRETGRAAHQAAEAKSLFLANMSHELRTPLTAVLGMADLLAASPLSADQRRWLSTLRSSGATLLALIRDILDCSSIEARTLSLEEVDFELAAAICDAVALWAEAAESKGLAIELDLAEDLPRHVHADAGRLQQVLFHLVGNAVKFTEHGGVRVSVAALTEDQPGMARVSFTVSDTGIGIAREQMDKLFSPFTQLDPSATRRHGGSGLGLAITARVVQHMGGTIHMDSREGEGSTVTVELPLPKGSPPATGAEDQPRAASRPLALLVAEDNPVNQTLLRQMLERMGHQVSVARNGQEALDLVRAGRTRFDAVLMDMQMPVMSGAEATRMIRALPPPQGLLPIIALTADAMADHRERYMAAGLDGYLTKPVSWRLLAETLDELTAATLPAYLPDHLPPPPPPEAAEIGAVTDAQPPVVDRAYLDDMRGWVGDEALSGLLGAAEETFINDLSQVEAAFAARDLPLLHETAHRLKGCAASIGATRLAKMAHGLQLCPPEWLDDGEAMPTLRQETRTALDGLAEFRSSLPLPTSV